MRERAEENEEKDTVTETKISVCGCFFAGEINPLIGECFDVLGLSYAWESRLEAVLSGFGGFRAWFIDFFSVVIGILYSINPFHLHYCNILI